MPALELTLDPAAANGIARLPGMQAERAVSQTLTWFDTPDAALARAGTCLVAAKGAWRMERLHAPGPGQPAAVLHAAADRDGLPSLPDGAEPVARLDGKQRTLRHGATVLTLLTGAVPGQPPIARLRFDGPAPEVADLARTLARTLPVQVPGVSLSSQILAAVAGEAPASPPRPEPRPAADTREVLTDLVGALTATLLGWSHQVTGASPEPVHQMRVTIRRLRSALTVFRPAAACDELEALRASLHAAAATLGAARDWDVFLDGTAARMAAAYPTDKRVAALVRTAAAQRGALYSELEAFLAGPEFRLLAVDLAAFAALRPWPEAPHQDVIDFASTALARRAKKVRKAGRGIESLPVPALHELRKDCKRLRYTADFFASLFPARAVRRYTKRLARLQEELGRLNDGAAVPGLLAQLGRLRNAYAAGLAEGFSAAHATPARALIEDCWHRFRHADSFWTG